MNKITFPKGVLDSTGALIMTRRADCDEVICKKTRTEKCILWRKKIQRTKCVVLPILLKCYFKIKVNSF